MRAIRSCARILKKGGLVAFPTETVYGLGAKAFDRACEKRIYRVKKRPKTKPLTVLLDNVGTIKNLRCALTPEIKRLAKKFWPGPLTMILRAPSGKSMGFRIPDNRVALKLIKALGRPLIVPSANLSGKAAATDAEGVLRYFYGSIEAVLDGGTTHIGTESTVVDMTGKAPRILRRGAIPESEIMRTCFKKRDD